MNLKKMLILASMALAVVAVTAPAAAQAQEHGLYDEDGRLGNTAPVTLTSTNLKTTTGLGELSCAHVNLHYHVEHNGNNGSHALLAPTQKVAGTETNNATTEGCLLNNNHTVHILLGGTHTVTMDTWGRGVAKASFKAKITHKLFGTIECSYTGDVAVQGINETNTVTVKGKLASGCGEGEMHGTFDATTHSSQPIFGSFVPTP